MVSQITYMTKKVDNDNLTLENQPESLINEAISLISIDDSSVKLTINGEANNLYVHLAKDGH